jgi:capsular polysaccharide biosynthesis protein
VSEREFFGVHDVDLSIPDPELKGQAPGTAKPDPLRNVTGDEPGGHDDLLGASDHTIVLSVRGASTASPERAWAQDDWASEDMPAPDPHFDASVGLSSLGFLRAALRRRARVWGVIALIGLLAGTAYLKEKPPAKQATVELEVGMPPASAVGQQVATDQGYMQSLPVATLALQRLRLNESPTVFLAHYTATATTNTELTVTVKAGSASEAVREANALAAAFQSYQKTIVIKHNQLVNKQYDQQVAQAQQQLDSITKQISGLSAGHASSSVAATLSKLHSERERDTTALTILTQTIATNEATSQAGIAAEITGTFVLSPGEPVVQSRVRPLALFVGGGLLGGLVLGMGIVIIGALISDRLRRRDDVARVLGAPVRLSVGRIRASRWLPGRRRLGLARSGNVQRVVDHLHDAVRHSSGFPASLAVVPVDDAEIPAVCLVSLALTCAKLGLHVVLADLCPGAPAARLLQVTEPGVRSLEAQGDKVVVAIPDADDVRPVGPLPKSRHGRAPKPLIAACMSADMLLTLAPLDPALGGEHLRGWGTSLVAMVTAGRSSAQRIFAVGEMIRQAGIEVVSAVLIGADKGDESLGVTPEQAGGRSTAAGASALRPDAHEYLASDD